MGIPVLVAETDFLAVGQEDERHAELIGIAPSSRGYSKHMLRPSVSHHTASLRSWSILTRAKASLVTTAHRLSNK